MIELIDKILIFISCLALYAIDAGYQTSVIPVIAAMTLSAFNSYFDGRISRISFMLGYIFVCQFEPQFLVFIPLICYDNFVTKEQLLCLFAVIPYLSHLHDLSKTLMLVIVILMGISYLLRYRTFSFSNIKIQYMLFRDASKEGSLLLQKKNSELMEKQDYEINMATLNERNRIAMEIHDNVGHLLSRCLLQLGALMAINKDEALKESLTSIKNTLSQAMDSTRSSVHNLHAESIDLYSQINGLVDNFKFCPIHLDYDIISHLDIKLKYCFISVVKEALSNIIKHSNATEVTVALREHPALYQLIIQDNGKVRGYSPENGIGLNNIAERVRLFNGNLHINIENGFKIFISIPKAD
ncbi:MAG: two-component sensor histidine kinase [Eubacterium sp.]|nr:two-component sensor histidine kinase [Eubacterium sp.]